MDRSTRSLAFLMVATVSGMALWFMAAAVIPDMAREAGLPPATLAWMSSVVPFGFAVGALLFALTGIPDRFDPRAIFAVCAIGAAMANLAVLWVPIGSTQAVALRLLTGVLMAGTWPVSMKIAVGWTTARRGLLMGSLVAALVVGQAAPYLLAWVGGADWRLALVLGSVFTLVGGLAILLTDLGPHHAQATRFRMGAIALAWTDPKIRAAILGYLGHMWEFIAFWSWVGVASAVSFGTRMAPAEAVSLGKLTGFLCIIAAVPACVLGGVYADRIGKGRVAAIALAVSGSSALLSAAAFGGPVWLTIALMIFWGTSVVPDSPQFSAIVADHAPPQFVGSLLTFQASLGFLLTAFTVQSAPVLAGWVGWPGVFVVLSLGPIFGLLAMRPVLAKSGQ